MGIAAGSDSDMPHLESIKKELSKFKIPSQIRICSAHKQPARLETLLGEYNKSTEPLMLVGCAGGTDALSGTASYFAKFAAQYFAIHCPQVAAALEASIAEKGGRDQGEDQGVPGSDA